VDVSAAHWVILAAVPVGGTTPTRDAREVVRKEVAPYLEHRVLNDVLSATGELVKNALQHATGPYVLTVRRHDEAKRLRIGVIDGNPVPPRQLDTDPWERHGQGLKLVDSVAASWGSTPTATGKEVWFELVATR
jgi:hypothetical protein